MNAAEKMRALVAEPMRDGRIWSEAYPETIVASVCGGPRITLGDCAELLHEIDSMRDELITGMSLLARAYRCAGNDVAANSVEARLRALRGEAKEGGRT